MDQGISEAEHRTRAVAESRQPSSGFLEKFVLLFFAFAFVAMVAGGVAYYQTERTIANEQLEGRDFQVINQEWAGRIRYRDHMLNMQNRTFDELTRAVGNSLQSISAMTWSYDEKLGPNDLGRRLDEYQRSRSEWQKSEIRLRALLETYFGSAARDEFEFEISREVEALGADVERIYLNALQRAQAAETPVAGETGLALQSRYKDLEVRTYTFLVRLLDEIKAGYQRHGEIPPDYAFTPPLRSAPDRIPGQIE